MHGGPGTWLRGRAAVAGFGHTRYGRRGELSAAGTIPLVVEAVLGACEDAGIPPSELDGFSSYSGDSADAARLATALGIDELRFTAMGWGGGGGGMGGAYLYAAMAVATGQANYVAVTRGVIQPPEARFGSFAGMAVQRYPAMTSPGQAFALAARRHMHEFGTSIDHFGEVAINARLNAASNPDARFRDPITMEDHHSSRLIADPLRLFDFCMESDVGACCIVTSAERARDLRQPPAYIAGVSMGAPRRWGGGHFWFPQTGGTGYQMAPQDFTSAGHRTIADNLYANAGMGPGDVDVALIYDHFTPMVLMKLEDYGFVEPGESGPFVADGNIRRDGSLPVNTHGGNLAEVYADGMTHVFEAVRQMRGTSPNQIEGAEVALVVAGASPAPSGGLLITKDGGARP